MAANIFHGAPGSFKSASAVWFELLPALRAGRVVVTNIEGFLPKQELEIELDEVFPESAQVWRVSSQTKEGLFLWRRWFWWMPIGALIIMDEVQDIFPKDAKVFAPIDFDAPDYAIDTIKDKLPSHFVDYFYQQKENFKPDLTEGSFDDTGAKILDSKGHVIYPQTMREANMRHRKYNWDIIYCTPDISDIHNLVRAVCQYAYKHKYFDSLESIPYFNRRPRIHEHSPRSSGETINKDTVKKWQKVPVEVHRCYRSTSTENITKRAGINGLKNGKLLFVVALLFFIVVYWVYQIGFKTDSEIDKPENQNVPLEVSPPDFLDSVQDNSVSNPVNDDKSSRVLDVPVDLPYEYEKLHFVGFVDVRLNKQRSYKNFLFNAVSPNGEYSLNEEDLYFFGIEVKYINPCKVRLKQGNKEMFVYCPPKKIEQFEDEQAEPSFDVTSI